MVWVLASVIPVRHRKIRSALSTVAHAVRDIGSWGSANLETDAGPGSLDADMRRNLSYIGHVIDGIYG